MIRRILISFITIVIASLIIYWLFNNRNMKTYREYMKRKNQLEESIQDFNAEERYANQNMVLAINREEEKLCISVMKQGQPVPLIVDFKDIIGTEVLEDGVAVPPVPLNSSTEESSAQAEQASADKGKLSVKDLVAESKRIKRIDLKIMFNDSQNPSVLANFLFWEVAKVSKEYQQAIRDASYWHKLITESIQAKDQEE
ncbi:MAG: hypothetical protein ACOX3R_12100 [Desulfitobacteriia bacterium]